MMSDFEKSDFPNENNYEREPFGKKRQFTSDPFGLLVWCGLVFHMPTK